MKRENATTVITQESKTVESKNPHEVSLGKFLRARAVHVTTGYVMLMNGQIIKKVANG